MQVGDVSDCVNGLVAKLRLPVLDVVVILIVSAVSVHLIFKRYEPMHILVVSTLLLLLPAILTVPLIDQLGIAKGFLVAFATYFATLLSSITLYRISPFHPLARYPGPIIAKVSKIYHVAQVWSGKQHLYLQRLHDRYGDIVRFGPNEVSIRDVSCIAPMLGTQGMPKGPMWEGKHCWPEIHTLIGCSDIKEHQRRRRPWNRAFSTAAMKEYNPIIQKRLQELGDALAARQGEVVNLADWISFFTYDFMGDLAFGGWTNMVREGGDHAGLWRIVKSGLKVEFAYEHVPWLSYYTRNIPGATNDEFRGMVFGQTVKRYACTGTTKDLFYYLCNEDGAEKEDPPKPIVVVDGAVALIAGSDTTSTVLASTFYCLLRNADTYKRLQAEVDRFYPPGADSLAPDHLPEMHYLEAVIMEALRLFPAVPSGSQRTPERGSGGKTIGPYYIPEGTQTRIHFWSVHRDPRNFSRPETFWPDRWLIADGLQKDEGVEFVHNPNAWIPFSLGPANCVGKNLALQEMRMVLVHLLHRFSFRFAGDYNPEQYEWDIEDRFVVAVGRLPVIVERRD